MRGCDSIRHPRLALQSCASPRYCHKAGYADQMFLHVPLDSICYTLALVLALWGAQLLLCIKLADSMSMVHPKMMRCNENRNDGDEEEMPECPPLPSPEGLLVAALRVTIETSSMVRSARKRGRLAPTMKIGCLKKFVSQPNITAQQPHKLRYRCSYAGHTMQTTAALTP